MPKTFTILYRRYGQIEIAAASAADARAKFQALPTPEVDSNLGSDGDDFEITDVTANG